MPHEVIKPHEHRPRRTGHPRTKWAFTSLVAAWRLARTDPYTPYEHSNPAHRQLILDYARTHIDDDDPTLDLREFIKWKDDTLIAELNLDNEDALDQAMSDDFYYDSDGNTYA